MAWIEIHQSLTNNPKVLRLSTMLDRVPAEVIGHLTCLWLWCVDHAPEGDLSGFDPEVIAAAGGWAGEADKFVEALIGCRVRRGGSGFLDREGETLTVHDWDDYAGSLIKYRARRAERRRKQREIASTGGTGDDKSEAKSPQPAATIAKPADDIRRAELDTAVKTLLADGVDPATLEAVVREALEKGHIPGEWLSWLRFVCNQRTEMARRRGTRRDGDSMQSVGSVFQQVGALAQRMMEKAEAEGAHGE